MQTGISNGVTDATKMFFNCFYHPFIEKYLIFGSYSEPYCKLRAIYLVKEKKKRYGPYHSGVYGFSMPIGIAGNILHLYLHV